MPEPTTNGPAAGNQASDTSQRLNSLQSSENGRSRWRTAQPLILVIVFSVVLRLGIVSIPLERDEGEYAYIAQRWLAGDLPYRDAFDQKPPGIFVAYAALFALGAKSIQAIHWLGHAQLLGTLVFVYLIGRRLFSQLVGWVAALFTVVLVMDATVLGNAANTELFAIFPLAAGMFFALRAGDNGGFGDALVTGLCGGLALCFKQVTLSLVLFYLVWILVSHWRSGRADKNAAPVSGNPGGSTTSTHQTRSSLLLLASSFVVGVCVILVPTCLYFVWHGAWADFYDCVVGYNLDYSSRVPLRLYGMYLWSRTKVYWIVFAPIFAVALFGMRVAWVRGTSAVRPCLWWWLALFLAVNVGGFYREHYFILIMPAVALLAAYGVEVLAPVLEPKRKEWQGRVAAVLAVVAVIWTLFLHSGYYWSQSPETVCRWLYGNNPFSESITLAKLMREKSKPTDKIFICGSEPQILFYADRASASRYIFVYPLFSGASDAQSRQKTVIEEIRRARPKFIVLVIPNAIPTSYAAAPGSPKDLLKELFELVSKEYSSFAAVTLGVDWTTRMIQPVLSENGELGYVTAPGETVTMQVWELRDSNEYTERQTNSERSMNSWREMLRSNLDELHERIDRAARASGRASDDVRLVAVTKQVDESVTCELVDLGVNDLGENRPQELWRKQQLVRGPVRWHLVGTLQKNKARRTLPIVHLLHSVDSDSLLKRLDELAAELDLRPEVLLEVNVSGEATKHGFRPEELSSTITESEQLARVQIRGLMTMAPYDDDPNRARPCFATLRELRDRLASQAPPNCRLTELSMGMSGDFEAAISEGATMVRIGSALFEGIDPVRS